ncbi:MAG: hypothetical protein GX446_10785 [Chthonomonadales bacterium]|nr:hypothetical protein [Chthonomonadales bacterium]
MRHMIIALVAITLPYTAGAEAISPDQAVAAVARFTGTPQNTWSVRGLLSWHAASFLGPCYEVVPRGASEVSTTYSVRMADGVVVEFWDCRPEDVPDDGYNHLEGGEKVLPVSVEQAEGIAREFASRHYDGFGVRRWYSFPDAWGFSTIRQGPGYEFQWFEVLGDAGALAPWPLEVSVSGYTGRVTRYVRPPDRPMLAPVRPLVSRRHAEVAVLRFIGAAVAPPSFEETWLQVREDVLGVQRLAWFVRPAFGPERARQRMPLFTVDAMSGDVLGWMGEFATASWTAPRLRAKSPPSPGIRIGGEEGRGPGSFVSPALRGGSLWLRAEHLRAVDGVQVDVTRKGVTVHHSGRTIGGTDLGARWRDYGWWVPLRQVAKALGWRVDWIHDKKEAVLHTGR